VGVRGGTIRSGRFVRQAVRKLRGLQHDQHVQDVGKSGMPSDVLFEAATPRRGRTPAVGLVVPFNRCLTIRGGTSDIKRNVIAERPPGVAPGTLRHRSVSRRTIRRLRRRVETLRGS